jgi:hypothetical protein
MKIIEKVRKWKEAADTNTNLYDDLQKESIAAVLGGMESPAWETWMRHFHSNESQLRRLMGNDNLDPQYKDEILAYIGGGGICGGGTRMALPLNMPDTYKTALDNISHSTLNDGSDPEPLP